METTGVAALKARLSRYLDRVKGGQEVVVTEHGRPIAKLVPLPPVKGREARRDRLARAGFLILGRGRVRASLGRPPKGPPVGRAVLQALLDDRRAAR